MNQEFLEAYNQELHLLYEQSKEFAEEFPGIAERLGGLTEDRLDPGIAGLLEGTAFLAARVQVKLKSEFATFTTSLLEQLLPNYLAPTPSAMLVQIKPKFDDPNLVKGLSYPTGAYLDAAYLERGQRISCRFSLAAPIAVWPLLIDKAEYFPSPGPLQALGLDVIDETHAGLRLRFTRNEPVKDGANKKSKPKPVKELLLDDLPIHIVGNLAESITIYEQLLADCRRITIRYLDANGDPVFIPTDPNFLDQIGFSDDEKLFPNDPRFFAGFALLREFYVFQQKFIGVRLRGLRKYLAQIEAEEFDVLFEFEKSSSKLANVVNPDVFRLHAAPAVNHFEEMCSRVRVDGTNSEVLVSPDSSPSSNYEIHQIKDVFAHYSGVDKKIRVYPLYSLPEGSIRPQDALYYTFRRRPRRLSANERRLGVAANYSGTETYISLFEPAGLDAKDRVQRLQIQSVCSNRHLTEQLPIGQSDSDFHLNDNTELTVSCIAGPSSPRESIANIEPQSHKTEASGEVLWRLVNFLSFNYLGLKNRSSDDPASGLRELLSLFADLSNSITERQIRAITGVTTRSIVRSLRRDDGFHTARGVEITVTFDEKGFEGSGIMLLGAILDRFFADYAHINSFTETVIKSQQRGIVKRWPARTGNGPIL